MKKVKDLKNKFKNKLCFICGAGPSLNSIDLNQLKNYVVLAVNSGIVGVPWADFYVSDDIGTKNWTYFYDLKKLKCINLLYEAKLKEYAKHLDKNKVIYFSHKTWFSPPNTYFLPEGLQLTKGEPIIGSRTSYGSSIHLAYIMGCNPVVLLGNDCCLDPKTGYRYFWQFYPQNKQPKRLDYNFNRSNQNIGFDRKSYINYWKHFVKVNKEILKNEFKVYDCSSPYDFFEKSDIKTILKKYGDRVK